MRFRYLRYLIPCMVIVFGLTKMEALAGPPFKTDDPEPVEYHHWEFYAASEQEFTKGETNATCPHFEVNYGLAPNLQVHLVAPLGYVHSAGGTRYGYSDTEIGAKYRFIQETETVPQVGVFPMVEIPTGDETKQLGAGRTQVYIPAWAQKSWGKLTSYAGGGFWYNPGPGRRNWIFAGWEAQYDFSAVITIGGELFYQTADVQDSGSSEGFNVGGIINLNENYHILFSLGHSISGAATTTGYFGFQLTV